MQATRRTDRAGTVFYQMDNRVQLKEGRMRISHATCWALGLVFAIAAAPLAAVAQNRTALPGSAPSWANAKNYAGPANASDSVGFRVYLGWKNPDAVLSLAQAVSDPRSPNYRQYLTPAQFR